MEQRQQENIPESAAAIYAKNDKFRDYINNLDLTVKWYNKVREETLEVEFPLIEGQLEEIDQQLKKALEELNWNSEGAWEYIQETRDKVHDLEVRTQKCKDNVKEVQNIMSTWKTLPLFERSDVKHDCLIKLDDREERCNKRYTEIEAAGEKIHALLKQNLELFRADENSDIWRSYVDYVDEMVVDGFFNTIHCTIKTMLSNTETNQTHPLHEAKLELHVSH